MSSGIYRPLFSVAVEHGYFSDGLWNGLHFEPDAETSKMAGLSSLVIRQTGNGVRVSVDDEDRHPLRMWAAGSDGRLRFRFKVRAQDKEYANYTDYSVIGWSGIPCFDNLDKEVQAGGGIRLSRGALVTEADFREIDALIGEGMIDSRERRVPPDFIVTVYVVLDGEHGFDFMPYLIGFGARRSYWKYYMLGDMNRSDVFIVDQEKKVEFLACGEVMLAGNRPARVFRSNQPIFLLEKSECRFQLRECGVSGEKVLIKRLPLASKTRLGSEMIDGRKEVVLENFVQY